MAIGKIRSIVIHVMLLVLRVSQPVTTHDRPVLMAMLLLTLVTSEYETMDGMIRTVLIPNHVLPVISCEMAAPMAGTQIA